MGIIKRGILGGFSGKVANVVGTSWKGRAVMKSLPLSVANPNTAGQIEVRGAFSFLVKFASTILSALIVPLMNRFAGNVSGYNYFTSRNFVNFTQSGLDQPANLNFGTGKLGDTQITSASADASTDIVEFTWGTTNNNAYKQATDEAYFLIINLDTSAIIDQGDTGSIRSDGIIAVGGVTGMSIGQTIACYLIFLRADGTEVGNTAYLSTTVVA